MNSIDLNCDMGESYGARLVVYQAGAVDAFGRAAGGRLHHVKCHGALYNMSAMAEALSDAIALAAQDILLATP